MASIQKNNFILRSHTTDKIIIAGPLHVFSVKLLAHQRTALELLTFQGFVFSISEAIRTALNYTLFEQQLLFSSHWYAKEDKMLTRKYTSFKIREELFAYIREFMDRNYLESFNELVCRSVEEYLMNIKALGIKLDE